MKQKFFELARKLSYKSSHRQHRLGCVIVKKNQIIGLGFNQIKTHPKSIHKYNMLHAEISALIGIGRADLKGCVAYVYRENRYNKPSNARPCEACMQALTLSGIKKVYYSYDGTYKEECI